MTHFIMMFLSYENDFLRIGEKLWIMTYDFNDVAPQPFYDNILVASDYLGVSRSCGLHLWRSELYLWPWMISEWAAHFVRDYVECSGPENVDLVSGVRRC